MLLSGFLASDGLVEASLFLSNECDHSSSSKSFSSYLPHTWWGENCVARKTPGGNSAAFSCTGSCFLEPSIYDSFWLCNPNPNRDIWACMRYVTWWVSLNLFYFICSIFIDMCFHVDLRYEDMIMYNLNRWIQVSTWIYVLLCFQMLKALQPVWYVFDDHIAKGKKERSNILL